MIKIREKTLLHFWIALLLATPLFFGFFGWWTQCQIAISESEDAISTKIAAADGMAVYRRFGFWRFQYIEGVLLVEQGDGFDFSVLHDLQRLTQLHMLGFSFDDNIIEQLSKCKSLNVLMFSSCSVSSKQLCKIIGNRNIHKLILYGDAIDDAFLASLVSNCDTCIPELVIASRNVTDVSVDKLKSLKGLKILELTKCPNVSQDIVEEGSVPLIVIDLSERSKKVVFAD